MKRNIVLCLSILALVGFALTGAFAQAEKPNIIFIMADDLGNADLGYRGSEIKTPNIDRLATGGVRLESFYGMQMCTPSRAALMTGRYPMRYGLQSFVIFPSHTYGLATEERTLPQALKEAGYYTAIIGKWHLGHADKKYWPQSRGFDYFYGNVMGEVDYFTRERGGVIDWQRNGKFLKEEGYYTDLLGNDAVRLIERHDTKKPLFLYLASLAPHSPYQAPPKYTDPYKGTIKDEKRRTYAAMITALDTQIDRILAALEKKKMRDNTLILFATDNSGVASALFATGARSPEERAASGGLDLHAKPPASNAPYRAGKGTLYEGGVRVVAFANWPAKLKPAVVNEPLHMVDVMPTLLALAGGKGNDTHPFDGKDMWPTLTGEKPSPHEDILINVEAFRGAVRKGNWKFIKMATLPGKTELYDLSKDPGEKENVAEQNPEIVRDLEARLLKYAKEQKTSLWLQAQVQFLGAQGKTVLDPDFDVDDGGLPREKPVLPKK